MKSYIHPQLLLMLHFALAAHPVTGFEPSVSLKPGGEGHYLALSDNTPFLCTGIDVGDRFIQVAPLEWERLLESMKTIGFNLIKLDILPSNPETTPWSLHTFVNNGDLLLPNEDYFDLLEKLFLMAGEHGFQIIANPIELLGISDPQTWRQSLTPPAARAYGRFLGKRFRSMANVAWELGGADFPGDCTLALQELADGIHTFQTNRIEVWSGPEGYSGTMLWNSRSNPAINLIRLPHDSPGILLRNEWYRKPPAVPIVAHFNISDENRHHFREYLWQATLNGSFSGCILKPDELSHLDDLAQEILVWRNTLSSLPWQSLLVDTQHSPQGSDKEWEFIQQGGWSAKDEGYIASAYGRDKRIALAYVSDTRAITINTGRIGYGTTGKDVELCWIDPVDGSEHPHPGNPLEIWKSIEVSPPSQPNAADGHDWILRLMLTTWAYPDAGSQP